MSDIEIIQQIRKYEKDIADDLKNINFVIEITKYLKDASSSKKVKIASMHSLRRGYLHILNSKGKEMDNASFRTWLKDQIGNFIESLRNMIATSNDTIQEPAIKTIMEFVSCGRAFHEDNAFAVSIFRSLLQGLAECKHELSAEILIMAKDEIFSKPDCIYYGLSILRSIIGDIKNKSSDNKYVPSNILDMLRVIVIPDDDIDVSDMLVNPRHSSVEIDSDDETHEDDIDSDSDNEMKSPANKGIKRKAKDATEKEHSTNKKRKLNSSERLVDKQSYKKLFSKVWLMLLSLKFDNKEHKIILKHLPDQVIRNLTSPLLLADYLTKSYEYGGVTAILSLEGLFQLILQHNLDYPNFFQSLYKLCKKEVFEAKYRVKFMRLLSTSLQSSNLPAYIVAAFIKRLAQLALITPSPATYYCLAQVIWLLRKHPQCQILIHRTVTSQDEKDYVFQDKYVRTIDDLEKCNALESSLWEIEILRKHHVHGVALLAKSLESPSSTSLDADAVYLNVNDFIDRNYSTMIEEEFKAVKSRGGLSYQPPKQLLASSFISKNFK